MYFSRLRNYAMTLNQIPYRVIAIALATARKALGRPIYAAISGSPLVTLKEQKIITVTSQ